MLLCLYIQSSAYVCVCVHALINLAFFLAADGEPREDSAAASCAGRSCCCRRHCRGAAGAGDERAAAAGGGVAADVRERAAADALQMYGHFPARGRPVTIDFRKY